MGFFSDHKRLRVLIPAFIIWGFFGGSCFAAVSFYIRSMYPVVISSCYFEIANMVYPFWEFGTITILSFTLGMIAADLFRIGIKPSRDWALIGLLSGICTALVGIMLVEIFKIPEVYWVWAGPFNVHILVGLGTLVMYILVSPILQVIGAWYQGSRQRSVSNPDDIPPTQAITGRRYRPWFFLVALLGVILVIPLGLFLLPIDTTDYFACPDGDTCQPGHQCGVGKLPDNVTVSRISPDSIRFSLKASSKICGSHNSFKILLDGNDVSNQELIAKSGRNVTITPSEGLGRQDGSSVILQGKDLVVNKSFTPHIQVLVVIPDRISPWVQRDEYL